MDQVSDLDLGNYVDEFQSKVLIPLLKNNSFLLKEKKDKNRGLPRYAMTKRPFTMVNMLHLLSSNDSDKKMYIGKNQAEMMGGVLKEDAQPDLVQFWKSRDVDADGVEFSLERPTAILVPLYNATLDFEQGTLPDKVLMDPSQDLNFDLETSKKYLISRYLSKQGNFPDLSYINDLAPDQQQKEIINRLDLFHIEDLVSSPLGSKEYVSEMLSVQMLNFVVSEELGIDYLPNKEIFRNGFINLIKNDPITTIGAINNAENYLDKIKVKTATNDIRNRSEVKKENNKKILLEVPYEDRGAAKELGARWDSNSKKWAVNEGSDLNVFKKWLPSKKKAVNVDRVSFPKYSDGLDMDIVVNDVLNKAKERSPFVFERYAKESLEIKIPRLEKALDIGLGDNETYKKVAYSLCKEIYDSLGYATEKIYLDVDVNDKEKAKEQGARWDRKEASWFIPVGVHKDQLLSSFDLRKGQPIYLDVDFNNRAIVKEHGARWDANKKSWYFFGEELPSELEPFRTQEIEVDLGVPDHDFGIPEVDLGVPDHDFGIPEVDLGVPDYDFGIPEVGLGVPDHNSKLKEEKTYLVISYEEREEGKRHGARWDGDKKSWYYPGLDVPEELIKYKPENIERQQMPAMEASEEFRQFMIDNGYDIGSDSIVSGVSGRVSVEGDKHGKKSGFYVFYENPTGIAGGYITNNRTQEEIKWSATSGMGREKLSDAEIARIKELEKERNIQRALEKERIQKETTSLINKELTYAVEANLSDVDNNYLARKQVGHFSGVFINKKGSLLIPAKNIDGEILTVQYVNDDGSKIFKKGGSKQGAFHIIDEKEIDKKQMEKQFVIAEGYATGASIYEALGKTVPVVVSFDSGNMIKVGELLADKYQDAKILIAADNDVLLSERPDIAKNVGLESATKLASYKSNRMTLLVPRFTREEIEGGMTDFNDMVSLNKGGKNVGQMRISNSIQESIKNNQEVLMKLEIKKSLEDKEKLELKRVNKKARGM